ncbi:choice-of-anchor A domain-containing protein [Duganella sp. 1224]|uniref:collagen-binding domain-containing protein n=1 Tax=Duganella sp. 1224 TaxID=2587052 RepID=UPI001841CDD6|nr:collagen-binding domain-containing protein [Duganella sp. 1224]NYE63718.1 choice-of-anchor A domain-containing protein [Duganella sp. 1224]
MTVRALALTSIAAAAMVASSAHAAPLTAKEVLEQFNVVTLGSATVGSHIDGRTYVGGSLSGQNAVLTMKPSNLPTSDYAGLTVRGSLSNVQVTGGGVVVYGDVSNSTVNNGNAVVYGASANSSYVGSGSHYIAGAVSGGNVNTTKVDAAHFTADMTTNVNAAQSTDMSAVLRDFSAYVSTWKSTGSTVAFSNDDHTVTFNAKAASNGVAVFDLTTLDSKIFSSSTTDFVFNMNGATSAVLNTNDSVLNLSANFNRTDLGNKLLWNFAGATSVTFNRTFDGQILAVDGTFSNQGGANVEGGVYAKGLIQGGEIHQQSYIGSVPEPETYAMLLGGLGLMGFMARRRQKAAAAR